ncbi:RNA polymerase sigma factor [Oceanobacillus picturae]|uniref:RNA polymerase sigma factor n=1 Tax=Oceanobacillus picturae TaxID=171693 RepID=A0A0U9H7E1_9BACI|nr:sigma-70 family RNA polymerase sigma factor [Oceanobacillus picturae]GAQ18283.1 RNA polymerase sigma factor [Oceanobacillus picturae]
MTKKRLEAFEEIVKQNERRIHFHIHRLNLSDPHKEYFQEGLCAMWNAYETYEPDKGPMATYFNYTIRNRLVDLARKQGRESRNQQSACKEIKKHANDGNRIKRAEASSEILSNLDEERIGIHVWGILKQELTDNQWKWVYYYIISCMKIKEIAIQEQTSEEAVKSWGKQVRKKLRNNDFQKRLNLYG